MKFYKGYKGESKEEDNAIKTEFEKLQKSLGANKKSVELHLSDFLNRKALAGFGIGIVLVALAQLTPCLTIMTYGVLTFTKLGTPIDPHISSITLAISLILGSSATTYLADKLGRKKLNLISLLGTALALLATALYHYLGLIGYNLAAYSWIPYLTMSIVICVPGAGIVPLAVVCSAECLPTKVYEY